MDKIKIDFGKKRNFDTLLEARAFVINNNIEHYKIIECNYPDLTFYIVEWK